MWRLKKPKEGSGSPHADSERPCLCSLCSEETLVSLEKLLLSDPPEVPEQQGSSAGDSPTASKTVNK